MYDHYFSNFGRPPILDDLCKDSAPRHPLFWRRRFLKVFTIYGHGGHLGQWTISMLAISHSPNIYIGPEASEEKSFEILNIFPYKCIVPIHMHREANDLAVKRSNINVQYLF